MCTSTSELLSHFYVVCVTLMCIAGAGHAQALYHHVKSIAPILLGGHAPKTLSSAKDKRA